MKCYVGPEGKSEFLDKPAGVPVIVDVLRASSTIVVALYRGAAKVIPVEDKEDALRLGRQLGAVLIGERQGVRIDGFEHGNSPTEMMEIPLGGKTVVMTTTNGTRVMVEGGIIASTLNAGAVAEKISHVPHEYLLASGSPRKSDEDLCAAQLIELIARQIDAGATVDNAVNGVSSSPKGALLLEKIRYSGSGKKLSAFGFKADVDLVCTAIGRFPVVPVYHNGEITLH